MVDFTKGEEADIINCLKNGDERALRRIIVSFGPSVFGAAMRQLKNCALAEEVAQDVFVSIWIKPEAFCSERGSLRNFLLRITHNKSVDRIRHEESIRSRSARVKENLSTVDSGDATKLDPADTVVQHDTLMVALSRLSTLQLEMVLLVYFDGQTCREVAARLGIPESTAKTRLRDGLICLRKTARAA